MTLAGLALTGCPLTDDYAVARDHGAAGVSSAVTGGSSDSGGTVSTGGTSSSGGNGDATGGTSDETGGTSSSGGKDAAGGTSGSGGDTITNGGAPDETAGASGSGASTGGASNDTGGLGAFAGEEQSAGAGGEELGGASNAGQAGLDSSAGTGGAPDNCPDNPDKTEPGFCECLADSECLARRYSFLGTGTTVTDSMGGDSATVINGTLSGSGTVELTGGAPADAAPYVDLPDGILASLTDATLEIWLTWNGGVAWQRILDFGHNAYADATHTDMIGTDYLYLTPRNATTNTLRASFTLDKSANSVNTNASAALPTGAQSHVALVFEDATDKLSLYVNGQYQSNVTLPGSLQELSGSNANNWLGRSQFNDDPYLDATLYEFRVYSVARTAAQIEASYDAGPETLPTE